MSFPTNIYDVGKMLETMPMAPIFVIAHNILVTLNLRGLPGAQEFAQKHPFPSWFVCVTSCFSGKVIQNFLLGKPMIEIYLNGWNVALATFIWYLIFFSPLDVAGTVCNNKSAKAVLKVLKELHRIRGVKDGIMVTADIYSGNYFARILVGTIRGSGAAWLLRPLYQFICGDLKPENEFHKPGFPSKYALTSAVILLLQDTGYLKMDCSLLILILFLVGAIGQMLMLFGIMGDPYVKIENANCYVFFQLPSEVANKQCKKKEE